MNWAGEAHIYTQDPQNDDNHGTAVLGVLGSRDNGWGTKGICYGATIRTCGTYYKPSGGHDLQLECAGLDRRRGDRPACRPETSF